MMKINTISFALIKFSFIVQLVVLLASADEFTSFSSLLRRRKRNSIDNLYSNEKDDSTIEIDPMEQERQLKQAEENCYSKILNETIAKLSNIHASGPPDTCDTVWDTIICWPETQANHSAYFPCPLYVNKFNRKNKAIKHCILNKTTNLPEWTLTNFTPCLTPSEHFNKDLLETSIFEHHMKYINAINICGYTISLFSLALSIVILLRPKLRCPRNYVHINLFVTFALRTILVMLVEILRNSTSVFDMKLDVASNKTSAKFEDNTIHIPCRIIILIFRYSGSVYHVSIFSEAIYLMLLLKFPYYSEKKGSKFCILCSWILPFIWLIPWTFIRIFKENKWCWQTESAWNLVIDIPKTLLLIVNVVCTVFIIKILYSKMRSPNLSKEKLIKYRRLAKSILILIPIFGLHFIFFAWLPYAYHIRQNHSVLEVPIFYIESFFNAFQGLVVSIACCFIHREVRIECLLYMCKILKKIKILNSCNFKCLDDDYLNRLRFENYEKKSGAGSLKERAPFMNTNGSDAKLKPKKSVMETSMSGSEFPLNKSPNVNRQDSSSTLKQTKTSKIFNRICFCLSDSQRNDFYDHSRRKSSIGAASHIKPSLSSSNGFKDRIKLRSSSLFNTASARDSKSKLSKERMDTLAKLNLEHMNDTKILTSKTSEVRFNIKEDGDVSRHDDNEPIMKTVNELEKIINVSPNETNNLNGNAFK